MRHLKIYKILLINLIVIVEALLISGSYVSAVDCGSGTVINYSNCLPKTSADHSTLAFALNLTFSLVGLIAVLIIVLAGFKYITSSGKPDEITKAKDTIIYALVGLIVCASAVTIISFVAGYI